MSLNGQRGLTDDLMRRRDGQSFSDKMQPRAQPQELGHSRLRQRGEEAQWQGVGRNVDSTPTPPGVIDAFALTCDRWRLSPTERTTLLGYRDQQYFGILLLQGMMSCSLDVKDRIGYIIAISLGLGSLFDENAEAEVSWLRKPHRALGDRMPLAVMLEGHMAGLITVSNLVRRERGL